MKISVVIVDDQPIILAGLRSIFTGSPFRVIGAATCGREAYELTKEHAPDVVLLDVRIPRESGIAALARIKLDFPSQPVVMYSAIKSPLDIARAIALGASGFVSKGAPTKQLFDTLAAAARGESTWERKQLKGVGAALASPTAKLDANLPLTSRQLQVLQEVVKGSTNEEIAQALGIGYETVKEIIQITLRRIGVADRTQAAVWAVRGGVV